MRAVDRGWNQPRHVRLPPARSASGCCHLARFNGCCSRCSDRGPGKRPAAGQFSWFNHAGDGGRYAELVQNRDFEAHNAPAGDRFHGNALVTPKGFSSWYQSDIFLL